MSQSVSTQGREALFSGPELPARQGAGMPSDKAAEPLSIEAMADAARRRLKAAVGRSAGQYMRQMRAAWGRAE